MKTRVGKIAQLPKPIRDELNQRLANGKQGPELLKWLNALPETKKLLADKFNDQPITHQNLSEWRHGGYQDWLLHQRHMEWFDHFSENGTELAKHDRCDDSFEAMGRLFLVEIGQGLAALQNLKNPHERFLRLQNLMREFARLQNAFNFSRKIQLDFDKYQYDRPGTKFEPQLEDNHHCEELDNHKHNSIESKDARTSPSPPRSGGENIPQQDSVSGTNELEKPAISVSLSSPKGGLELLGKQRKESAESGGPPRAERAGANESLGRGEEALRAQGEHQELANELEVEESSPTDAALGAPASVLRSLGEGGSRRPDAPTSPEPPIEPSDLRPLNLPAFQPIPTPAPPTPFHKHKVHSIPIRGRRFVCIEG